MKTWFKDLIVLFLGLFLFLGISLPFLPIHSPDGGRYAEVPREMVVSGDYLTPHLNGIKYFEKPPLFYWMQAISMRIFGFNQWSAGLMNTLCAVGCALLVYVAGRFFYGRCTGWVAAIVFATSALSFALTKIVTLDFALTFFVTAALFCFIRAAQDPTKKENIKYWYLTYFNAGLAVLTKGLIGIVFLGMIVFFWLAVNKRWRDLKYYRIFTGGLLFLAIVLPWHYLVQKVNPEFFNFYFLEQHFLRYFTNYADRYHSNWYFVVLLFPCMLPWSVFLLQASWKNKSLRSLEGFWLIWAISIATFFSFSHSKLIPYLLPIFPPISLLIAHYLVGNPENKGVKWGFYFLASLCILSALSLMMASNFILAHSLFLTFGEIWQISLLIGLGGILLFFINYRGKDFWLSFIVTLIIFVGIELGIQGYLPIINDKSTRSIALVLKAQLKPEEEVISYQEYYQDLPYYLNRTITVADFIGEINWGVQYQPEAKAWLIDRKTMWARWQDHPLYVVAKKEQFLRFAKEYGIKDWIVIAEDITGHVVVKNR